MTTNLLAKLLLRRRAFRIPSLLAALAFLLLTPLSRGQGTFKFEGQPIGTVSGGLGTYTEGGMRFSVISPGSMYAIGGGVASYPDNGSAYLYAPDNGIWFGPTNTFPSSAAFNLISFDAAEHAGGGPLSLMVIGYKPMAGTVTNFFAMDGIIDGTGPLQDFQTFTLSSDFTSLFRVEIYGRLALDNVFVTSAILEPTTGSLALVGAGGAVAWSRFRRNRRSRQTNT